MKENIAYLMTYNDLQIVTPKDIEISGFFFAKCKICLTIFFHRHDLALYPLLYP